jgi:periplasmic protein TonB
MLPRAILFSSDERISELLIPVFAEFGVELETCDEIFGAVERMTAGGFAALIADWSEELEASFFLKTARDLTSLKSALVLAIVKQEEVDKVFQLGVDGVLIRPLSTEQVRNTLSTVGRFNPPPLTTSPDSVPSSRLCPDEQGATETTIASSSAIAPGPEATLFSSLAPVTPPPPSRALRFSRWKQQIAYQLGRSSRTRTKILKAALPTIALVALLASWRLGYLPAVSSLQSIGASVISMTSPPSPIPLATQHVQPAPALEVSRYEIFDADYDQHQETTGHEIEVTPVLPPPVISTTAAPVVPQAATEPAPDTEAKAIDSAPKLLNTEAKANEPAPRLAGLVTSPRIPASLVAPVQEFAAKPAMAKAATATHWMLQPVSLPEDVARGLVVHQVSPIYPAEALQAGVQGAVVLRALIGKDGSIQDLKLINGYVVLGRAAFDAVKQWKFKPYAMNGEFVDMQTLITVNFQHP